MSAKPQGLEELRLPTSTCSWLRSEITPSKVTKMDLLVALVVSEEPSKLFILRKALNAFHMIERETVKSALELLKNARIDLVILDSKVKEGHAFETAEKIRAAVLPDIP